MTNSQHANIYAALAAAQAEMGPALKDSVNPAFKSRYADLAAVLAACLPALNKHGLAMIQPPGEDDHGRYVSTILLHASGEKLECRVPLIVGKNDMQGYGSAVTYARRYGAMSMAGIAPDDDDGNAAAKSPPVTEPARQYTAPRNESNTAATEAIAYLGASVDLADLKSRWGNLPKPVQAAHAVIAAKDRAKAHLMQAPAPADLAGDTIPY